MFVSDESSFFNVATKESPSHPEKVLTGCKNSSSKTVPAGILFVLASALKAPGKSSSIFAVQLICTNIFMMVLVNILYYYGIMQFFNNKRF